MQGADVAPLKAVTVRRVNDRTACRLANCQPRVSPTEARMGMYGGLGILLYMLADTSDPTKVAWTHFDYFRKLPHERPVERSVGTSCVYEVVLSFRIIPAIVPDSAGNAPTVALRDMDHYSVVSLHLFAPRLANNSNLRQVHELQYQQGNP